MANVIAFPKHRRLPVCSEITQAQADSIQAFLREILDECPTCTGRGVFLFKDRLTGLVDHAPCPCGGSDADRVDFGGAA